MVAQDQQPLRVGIVGASPKVSWASRSHVPAIAALDSFTLTAVATSRAETARAAAEQFGAQRWFVGIDEILASDDVDVVVVAVKVPAHRELVSAALLAGKHVYSEWPLGVDTAEAQALATLAKGAAGRNAIGLQARSSPTIRYLRDLVGDGFVGEIESVSVQAFSSRGADPVIPSKEYLFDSGTGANLATIEAGHLMDTLEFVLGDLRPTATHAELRRPTLVRSDGTILHATAPDSISSILTTVGGAAVSVHIAQGSHALVTTRISLIGSRGALELVTTSPGGVQMAEFELKGTASLAAAFRPMAPPPSYRRVTGPVSPAALNVAEALQAFGDDIRRGTHVTPRFQDAVKCHQHLDRLLAGGDSTVNYQKREATP